MDSLRKSKSRGFVVSASGGADSSAVICLIAIGIAMVVSEHDSDTRNRLGLRHLSVVVLEIYLKIATQIRVCGRLLPKCSLCLSINNTFKCNNTRSGLQDRRALLVQISMNSMLNHSFRNMKNLQKQSLVESLVGKAMILHAKISRHGCEAARSLVDSKSIMRCSLQQVIDQKLQLGTQPWTETPLRGNCAIAGIDKAFLRDWLVWIEREGPQGIGPLNAMEVINIQQPTAELRPTHNGQTDESDLMPYDVLDRIERFAIRDQQTPVVIWEQLVNEFLSTMLRDWGIGRNVFFCCGQGISGNVSD